MAATATRRRSRRTPRKTTTPSGKTTFAVVTSSGVTLRENGYNAGATLALAQQLAANAEGPLVLTVERRDLFGPPAILYRVTRNEDDIVFTTTISRED